MTPPMCPSNLLACLAINPSPGPDDQGNHRGGISKMRIDQWIMGFLGTANTDQAAVLDSYRRCDVVSEA